MRYNRQIHVRLRFSLRTLLTAIALIAVGVAGLQWAINSAVAAFSPGIMVVNNTGQALEDVTCVLCDGATKWTESLDELGPGESIRFTRRVSDLFVTSIQFQLGPQHAIHETGGLATPRETYVLEIGPGGRVSEYYDSEQGKARPDR